MEAIKIEILNPKALKIINELQELKLIKIKEEPISEVKSYLKKMRQNSDLAPSIDEIASIVNDVRSERYGKK